MPHVLNLFIYDVLFQFEQEQAGVFLRQLCGLPGRTASHHRSDALLQARPAGSALPGASLHWGALLGGTAEGGGTRHA